MRILPLLVIPFMILACTNDKAVTIDDSSDKKTSQLGFSTLDEQKIKVVINEVYSEGFRFQNEEFEIMHLLSPELLKLCVNAKVTEQQSVELALPEEKPAIIEGEIFASLYEGFNEMEIVKLQRDGEECNATVRFTFSFEGDDETEMWEDQLVLTQYEGEWKLDNVVYASDRNYPKDLKTYLKEFDEKNWTSEN